MKRRNFLLTAAAVGATSLLGYVPQAPAHAQQSGTAAPAPPPVSNGPRKRLAILEFDYATVNNWWGGSDWNVGRGISDLLVDELVKDGTYSLIERKKLDEVMKEQQLTNSSAADPRTAVQVGKVLGVNALVTGSITQFGFDDKSVGLNGFGTNFAHGMFGGLHHKESKAEVAITARLIDPSTGEILATADAKGESKRGSWGGFGSGWGGGGAGGGGIDMESSNFQDTILGEATRKCVAALAAQLIAQQGKVTSTHIVISGKVADVDGTSIILNIGKDAGVSVGDVYTIERVVRTVKDPDTGKIIREMTQTLGILRVTDVEGSSATGTFSGAGVPRVGDRVKSQ